MQKASQEAITVETLRLLQETVDYLLRLPAVPVTRELCRKLQAHIDAPDTRAAKREADSALLRQNSRYGQKFSPAGLLLVQAEVEPAVATIKIPVLSQPGPRQAHMIRRLAEGLPIELHPGEIPEMMRR